MHYPSKKFESLGAMAQKPKLENRNSQFTWKPKIAKILKRCLLVAQKVLYKLANDIPLQLSTLCAVNGQFISHQNTWKGIAWTLDAKKQTQESPPAWTQEAYCLPCSHSNFLLFQGGSLDKKFFSQSEHVSSQIWCQKIFPLLGGVPQQNIFSRSEHVSSQIWCQKFFPLLRPGTLPLKIRDLGPPQKKSETWDPLKIWNLGPSPHPRLDQVPPPRNVNRLKLLPSNGRQ